MATNHRVLQGQKAEHELRVQYSTVLYSVIPFFSPCTYSTVLYTSVSELTAHEGPQT